MDEVSASMYKRLKGYWNRRGYERLNGSSGRRRKNRVELDRTSGSGSNRPRRRFWRIKITPKLKLRFSFSPKKFLIGLRDAYVNFMQRIANSRVIGSGYGGVDFGRAQLKEYDEKMIVEIYKSLVAAEGQLVPRDAGIIGAAQSQIVYRR